MQAEAGPSGSPAHPPQAAALGLWGALSPGHTEGPTLSRCWPARLEKM